MIRLTNGAISFRRILIWFAVALAAPDGKEKIAMTEELKALKQRLPAMRLDELDKLAEALKTLKVAVATEQRKKRGQRGGGVLGVNGQISRF